VALLALFRGNGLGDGGDGLADLLGGDVGDDLGVADFGGEDEAEFSGTDFFVGGHGGEDFFGVDVEAAGGQSNIIQERDEFFQVVERKGAADVGEAGGGDHAQGDGFAVDHAGVVEDVFDGVSEGVAEVQESADAFFVGIFVDDGGLDGDVFGDEFGEYCNIAGGDFGGVVGDEGKQRGIADDGVLDAFGQAAPELARRKRGKGGDVGDDNFGLVESADEIFSGGMIDADFSADGGIDGGEQRRGNLDKGDAAEDGDGDEAGEIADDSAAQCDHRRGAFDLGIEKRAQRGDGRVDGFVLLAGGKDKFDHAVAGGLEAGLGGRKIEGCDVGIGDEGAGGRGDEGFGDWADVLEQTRANADFIGGIGHGGDVDGYGDHRRILAWGRQVGTLDRSGKPVFVLESGDVRQRGVGREKGKVVGQGDRSDLEVNIGDDATGSAEVGFQATKHFGCWGI
jgi:hypothetical protein